VTGADVELYVGLLAAIALLAQLADWMRVPYPIVLVLGGLVLGLVPGVPAPELDPEVFFLLFLPPLLYSEAFLFSTDALRAAAWEIFLLAVGLVVATTVAVAVVAHALAGLPWPAAFVLGAVVGPTDPVAATAVIRRMRVSERIETVLEGESLVNDATALAAYKLAIGAAGAGAFSLADAVGEFFRVSAGGVAIGLLAAWLSRRARRWISVPEVEITLSLLMPFAAYLPAERLGVSGVLAAVTAGLLLGRHAHAAPAGTRLRRHAFWDVLVFLLNSLLFLLIGLGFPNILAELGHIRAERLVWTAPAVVATLAALRFAWMFVMPRIVSVLEPRSSRPLRDELIVLGWSGMRGGVTIAAALAVPVAAAGHPFPGRAEIVFLSYVVVLATLVLPGLTLGPLIGRLGLGSGSEHAQRDARARAHILLAALEHIEELAENDELPEEIAERLRRIYRSRIEGEAGPLEDALPEQDPAALAAREAVLAAQRAALAELEEHDQIGASAARDVERELTAEEHDLVA
jgi:CPA1 family monovalent cation:H+ antiporter